MPKLYVVHYTIGGYAREDADQTIAAGVYTDIRLATVHKMVCSGGQITELDLDVLPRGVIAAANEMGLIKDELRKEYNL